MTPSKTSGSYGGFVKGATVSAANAQSSSPNQQDNWGYEVTVKPRFDARTETSMGTMRVYVEIKIQLDTGAFDGASSGRVGGNADFGAGNKTEIYRGLPAVGGMDDRQRRFDLVRSATSRTATSPTCVHTDKDSGWTVFYTWTPTGPGVPPVKGSAPVPDGWSFSFGVDIATKHISKNQGSGGCLYLRSSLWLLASTAGLDLAAWRDHRAAEHSGLRRQVAL